MFDDVPSAAALEKQGARVFHATEAQLILEDLFFVSHKIRDRIAEPLSDGSDWEPDPLIADERFVAVRL
jgi:hypothetical protein